MPEKLLTLEEVSDLLGITNDEVRSLVEKGVLPAYKINGRYLRFRKEQITAIRREVALRASRKPSEKRKPGHAFLERSDNVYTESLRDKILDFVYFKDFYLISGFIILCILWIIFKR